jgi:pilus assembly protein Flp/PilA
MLALYTKIVAWLQDEEKGASMVEYALLVALIAIIAIVAVTAAGEAVSSEFNDIATTLN